MFTCFRKYNTVVFAVPYILEAAIHIWSFLYSSFNTLHLSIRLVAKSFRLEACTKVMFCLIQKIFYSNEKKYFCYLWF